MQTNDKNLIYGRHPVLDAIQAGVSIDKVFLQQGTKGELEITLRELTRARNIPVIMTPKERLAQMVRGNHQGIVAIMGEIAYHRVEELLPQILAEKADPVLLIIEGVTDIRNFGAIARSAELLGVDALIVPTRRSAQINAASMKASAGALATLPVCREQHLIGAVDFLQGNDIMIFASDLQAEKPLYDLNLESGGIALVLGAEDSGISKPLARQVDERFWIPQTGKGDSFNVSVAAGIMLYEVSRQRRVQ